MTPATDEIPAADPAPQVPASPPPAGTAPAGLGGLLRARLTCRFGGLYFLAAVVLAAGFLLRTALLIQSIPAAGFSPGDVVRIYAFGLLYDVVSYFYLMIPVAVFVALVPDRFYRSRVNRAIMVG